MKKAVFAVAVACAVCASVAGSVLGAASSYPSSLGFRSTASAVTGSAKLDTSNGTVDATTTTTPAQNATGWYAFDPGAASTTQLSTIPTTSDGKGWLVDPAGGATGFPAGNWTFTVKTDIPDSNLVAGAAVLTIGIWKGTISGGAFTPTGTILAPTDDPAAQDIRSGVGNVTTTVTYPVGKVSLAAGETLFVDAWRHQTAGINSGTASEREVDLLVNDGTTKLTHPAADDTGPTHGVTLTAVGGKAYLASGTLYYNGTADGSFTLGDALADTGAGPFQVTYPAVGTTGWTHPAENVTTGPAYRSSTYSWTAGSTTSPGAQTITGEDLAQQTSTATVTLTNDSTAPSGQTVTLAAGPTYGAASVGLTLVRGADAGSGVDAASGVVQRASAAYANGTCGTFGAYATVTLVSGADASVLGGNCYRYQYLVSDNVGNQAASAPSADAKVDTTPPAITDVTASEVTGAGDQRFDAAAGTVWFRPAGSGSFTLTATAADDQSGVAQFAFPNVSSTGGWTGSNGGIDTASPYTSPIAYTWTANAAAPGAVTLTATNGTGLTTTRTITIAPDTTAPSGQAVALVGGPYFATRSVPLAVTNGTDTGSGVDPSRTVVERASAPLSGGSCGVYGAYDAVTLASGADTTVQSGRCYRYRAKATDNVGNVSEASASSADAKIDTTAPSAPRLTFSALTNAVARGSTVWYRPGTSGSFTVTADGDGRANAGYAFTGGADFTVAGTGSSRTYTFRDAAAEVPPVTVTVTNGAGVVSSPATFKLEADSTTPALTITCNGRACAATPYGAPVTVTLAAADAGAGPKTIRYTTNGKDPSATSGTTYVRPLRLTELTRLKAVAVDAVGNATRVRTQVVSLPAPGPLALRVPARVSAPTTATFLTVKVTTGTAASVAVTFAGSGTRKPSRWSFALKQGSSAVALRLPRGLPRGAYHLTWTGKTGVHRTTRTTAVTLT
jgi:hypothetical protein